MSRGRQNSQLIRGFSLVELMIAITLGTFIVMALAIIFASMSEAKREQFKAAEQIENGRFSAELLTSDIRHAGFYGEFSYLPPAAASLPDPCTVPAQGQFDQSTANHPLAFYIQGYTAATLSALPSIPGNCATWLDAASVRPGSDILVIRRADTIPLIHPPGNPALSSAIAVSGDAYLQATSNAADIQYGTGATIDNSKTAGNLATTLIRKDFTQAAVGSPPVRPTVAAYIRKLHVHIYFVSNCREGSGASGTCTTGDDTIPTLKRLELTAGAGGTPSFTIVPLVEGIEFMKFRYGLDTSSAFAGRSFDGVVDSFVTTPPSVADWQNVVQVEVGILSRNLTASIGHSEDKTYSIGGLNFTPSGSDAEFKRHVFTTQAYVQNIGGRREF